MRDFERFMIWRRRNKLGLRRAANHLGVPLWVVQAIERAEISPQLHISDSELPRLASPGEEMWLLRKRFGMSVPKACAALDCSHATLHLIETDQKKLKARDIELAAEAYAVAVRTETL